LATVTQLCEERQEGASALPPDLISWTSNKPRSAIGLCPIVSGQEPLRARELWSRASLSEFALHPSEKVPGTKMRFWGVWTSENDDLVAYLKSNL
jgi:cytochrome c2